MNPLLIRRRGMMAASQGGGGLVYLLTNNDFLRGCGLDYRQPRYYYPNSARICYSAFDLLLTAGATYSFELEVENEVSKQMGVVLYNQIALDKVAENETFSAVNLNDSGWISNPIYVLTIPETINNSPTRGCRFNIRKTDNSPINNTPVLNIVKLTITEVV